MYHKIKYHVSRHSHRYRTVILTTLLIILVASVGGLSNSYYTDRQVINSFQKNFEKQGLAQLNAYSLGIESITEKSLSSTASVISNLAQQSSISQAVETKDYTSLTREFQNLTQIDSRFDTISLLNTQGIVVATGKTSLVGNSLVGNNLGSRDYFKQLMATKEPVLSNVFTSSFTGRHIIVFATPVITDGSGVVSAVLMATISLDGIAKNLKLPTTFLNGLSFALTDSNGNLIINQQGAPDKITNILVSEPALAGLNGKFPQQIHSEVNYLNQKVFAKAKAITISGNDIYLVSYYDQSVYQSDLAAIKDDLRTTLTEQRVRNLVLLLFVLASFYWLLKTHEKNI